MNITYKTATLEDADIFAEMRVTFFEDAHGKIEDTKKVETIKAIKEFFLKALVEKTFDAAFAFDGDKVVATSGICFYTLMPSDETLTGKVGQVQSVFTLPEYRGKGIGTTVFKMTMDMAKANECSKVVLNAYELGKPMYDKYGFKDAKGAMVYYL